MRIREGIPADAGGIVQLLLDCYGATYTVQAAQDPQATAGRIRSGEEIYAVAEDQGRLVGFGVLARKGPGRFEYYRCVVDQRARGRGLMRRMLALAIERARAAGALLITTGLVTSHTFAQRSAAPLGFKPLGLLLGVIPEFTTLSGIGRARQPVSLMMLGLNLQADHRPRRLRLPPAQRALARSVLEGLGIPCGAQRRGRAASPPLGWSLDEDVSIGLAHLRFSGHGSTADLGPVLASLETTSRVVWADVPAEAESAAELCVLLERSGFSAAAYLPLTGVDGADVVRFQRYLGAPLREDEVQVLSCWEGVRRRVFTAAGLPDSVVLQ